MLQNLRSILGKASWSKVNMKVVISGIDKHQFIKRQSLKEYDLRR